MIERKMISVEEALDRVLGHVNVLEEVEQPLLECLGLVLARDIRAAIDVPPADNSAMDGFAVRAESIAGATGESPRVLSVVAEVAAGHTTDVEVTAGKAIRIMTGAPLPRGADTVVPFEFTDEDRRKKKERAGHSYEIGVLSEIRRGDNIRLAGEDVPRGSLVLNAGTMLRSAEIGVLASLGYARAPVFRPPTLLILA